MISDLRSAFRSLWRRPTLVAALVLTLALGVGVNTAIYTLVDAVLLHPLSVAHPDRLVAVQEVGGTENSGAVTYGTYERLAKGTRVLDGVAASVTTRLKGEIDGGRQEYSAVAFVTNGYFDVLGVEPAVGRTMLPSDPAVPGQNPVVVLSWDYWQRFFGADRAVIGSSIRVNGVALVVVGVAPQAFRGTSLGFVPDLWVSLSMISVLHVPNLSDSEGVDRRWPILQAFGRLAQGVDPKRAAGMALESLSGSGRDAAGGTARGKAPTFTLVPLAEAATTPENRRTLWRGARLLYAIGAMTLILACLNIANLLVVRADERRVELAVRAALGAGVARLGRQLFAESVLLALSGGIAGIGVAWVATKALSSLTLPGRIALSTLDLGIDRPAIALALGLSLATALVFGLAPALSARRMRLRPILYGGAQGVRSRLRREVLIAIQVALSLVFLVGTALLVRTLGAGVATSLGFDPASLAAVSVAARSEGRHEENVAMYGAVVDQLEQTPGILSAAAGTHVPLAPAASMLFGAGPAPTGLYEPDPGLQEGGTLSEDALHVGMAHIVGDYFEALGIPILDGRAFTPDDGPKTERVMILNESAARALFPGRSPLGQQVHAQTWSFTPFWFTYRVVGVVQDTKYRALQDERVPFAFASMAQDDFAESVVTFIARTTRGRDAVGVLEQTVALAAPDLVLSTNADRRPRLVSDQVETVLAPQRLAVSLLAGFAVLALCIVAVGIYGTVAYSVSRRTAELGIRIALGAPRASILRLVVSSTGGAFAVGTAIGVLAAVAVARALNPLLYRIDPSDLPSFVVAVVAVGLVAFCAALVPSWRATQIDPVQAIHSSL